METIKSIIKDLKELDKLPESDNKNEVRCVVAMSDDYEIKVAITKTDKPRVYEIIEFEKIDNLIFKDKITGRVKMYGRYNTADLTIKILNGEVKLNGR